MLSSDLDYTLPPGLIAQHPAEPRDAARLLIVDRARGAFEHRRFSDLPALLAPGDLLVANDTSVLNARLKGRKPSGGAAEVLLLRKLDALRWEALVGGRRVARVEFAEGVVADVAANAPAASMTRVVTFNTPIEPFLDRLGETPLPPYIHERLRDPGRYQTVYARDPGSAAAPTAGLHFTPGLLAQLAARGVGCAFVTLHVGLDTFKPIDEATLEEHVIHTEWCALPTQTAQAINATRAQGGRVIAVGTTSARVIESARLFDRGADGEITPFRGDTNLFITPGFQFRWVDQLITNFHLPRSTLLALVGALTGMPLLRAAYQEAITQRYRFYSFGDAMLIR